MGRVRNVFGVLYDDRITTSVEVLLRNVYHRVSVKKRATHPEAILVQKEISAILAGSCVKIRCILEICSELFFNTKDTLYRGEKEK